MYKELFDNFYKNNQGLIIADGFVTLVIYCLEIIVLSYISGMVFVYIDKKSLNQFFIYLIIFIIIFCIVIVLYWVNEYIDSIMVPELNQCVRQGIFALTNDKKVGLNTTERGELITKLTQIPYKAVMGYTNLIAYIIPFILTLLLFCGYMFYIHSIIGIFSSIVLTMFIGVYIYYYVKITKVSYARYVYDLEQSNQYEDLLSNFENISLHNTFEFEKERLTLKESVIYDALQIELRKIAKLKLCSNLYLGIYIFVAIIICSYLVIQDKIPIFKLIILTTGSILLLKTFENLVRRCSDTIMEFGPLARDKFVDKFDKDKIHHGAQKNFFGTYTINIENLHYKEVLKGINLQISYKEQILITGEVGTGKSTLLKLLCGYFYPTQGKIKYDTVEIQKIDISYLRQNVTMMHQQIVLFKRGVLDNIFYGSNIPKEQQLKELKKMSIYSRVQKFINLPDAKVLSGGQKQIVLLLRCLFRNCKILLLDEPTANMDPATKKIILEILVLLVNKCTVICVSHDSSIYSFFKKHYILRDGKLV